MKKNATAPSVLAREASDVTLDLVIRDAKGNVVKDGGRERRSVVTVSLPAKINKPSDAAVKTKGLNVLYNHFVKCSGSQS